jgi:cytochrome c oxidase subunit II
MKKLFSFLIVAVFALTACSPTNPPNPEEPDAMEEPTTIEEVETPVAPEASAPISRNITVSAKRFEFTPSAIRVKANEKTTLTVKSEDTTHTIAIPVLGLNGTTVTIEDATPGTYEFICSTFCGDGHGGMKGTLIVE